MLKGCRVEDLDEVRGRAAGQALARSGTSDVIDASVALGAIARGDLVVTSDPDDLAHIADALNVRLEIASI